LWVGFAGLLRAFWEKNGRKWSIIKGVIVKKVKSQDFFLPFLAKNHPILIIFRPFPVKNHTILIIFRPFPIKKPSKAPKNPSKTIHLPHFVRHWPDPDPLRAAADARRRAKGAARDGVEEGRLAGPVAGRGVAVGGK
jgi:hypothetical protein